MSRKEMSLDPYARAFGAYFLLHPNLLLTSLHMGNWGGLGGARFAKGPSGD